MIKSLIVEDEKPISDLLKIAMTKAGYQCTCVYDGIRVADLIRECVLDEEERMIAANYIYTEGRFIPCGCEISVADEGCGMEEEKGHVFATESDKEVFAVASRIPTQYRVNGDETKISLRGAAVHRIGEENAKREKLVEFMCKKEILWYTIFSELYSLKKKKEPGAYCDNN